NLPQSLSRHRRNRFRPSFPETPVGPATIRPFPRALGSSSARWALATALVARDRNDRANLLHQVPSTITVKLEGRTALRALYHRAIRLIAASCDDGEDAKRRPAMPLRKNLERL